MSRRLLIAGNWKMNLTFVEAETVAAAVAITAAESPSLDVAIFPSFPWILPVRKAVVSSGVFVGAQNCSSEESGAYTGEVSARQLVDVCDFILAGHSERRHIFGETNELVGRKVSSILAAGSNPVLCVGETLDERQSNQARAVVEAQLAAGLATITEDTLTRLTIAYEPVWAIGTGVAATPDDAQEMCRFIRSWLEARFGASGGPVRILYGGSVTPENAEELFRRPDIDGGLVGGASLKAQSFQSMILMAERVSRL